MRVIPHGLIGLTINWEARAVRVTPGPL